MNIFFLDKFPVKSAEYLCDKHVPKMLLESAQMLSTAVRKYENLQKPNLFLYLYINLHTQIIL